MVLVEGTLVWIFPSVFTESEGFDFYNMSLRTQSYNIYTLSLLFPIYMKLCTFYLGRKVEKWDKDKFRKQLYTTLSVIHVNGWSVLKTLFFSSQTCSINKQKDYSFLTFLMLYIFTYIEK